MKKQIDDELTLNQPVWGRKWFFASINPENPLILSILIQTIGGRQGGTRSKHYDTNSMSSQGFTLSEALSEQERI